MALITPQTDLAPCARQGARQVAKLDQKLDVDPLPPSEEVGGLAVTGNDFPNSVACQDIIDFNHCRVALVFWSEWHSVGGSGAKPFVTYAPVLLTPFSSNALLVQVCELVCDANRPSERRRPSEPRVAKFADVCVDFVKMEVIRLSGEVITLTNQEFKTLRCFLSHPERVFSRNELLNEAWGYNNYPSTRTVDNYILKLREKLERDPARPIHFKTIHGVGYKFIP